MRPWNKESKERRLRANIPTRFSHGYDDDFSSAGSAAVPSSVSLLSASQFERQSWPMPEGDAQRAAAGYRGSLDGFNSGLKPASGGRHKALSSLNPASAGGPSAGGHHRTSASSIARDSSAPHSMSRIPPNPDQSLYPTPAQKRGKLPPHQKEPPHLRQTTPNVLYKDQFLMHTKSAHAQNEHVADITSSMPQPDLVDAVTQRPWQKMEMRMPPCRSQEEADIISATAALIVARGVSLRVVDRSHAVLDMSLAERPTSRLQAELLMGWLSAQLQTISVKGRETRAILLGNPAATNQRQSGGILIQAIGDVVGEMDETAAGDAEMANRLMSLWDQQPQPFMFLDVTDVMIEGVRIPNDKRFLRTMLQVLGTAAAAITHQVTMHCHERGFVLASIWNTQQGLLELAFEQTQLRNDSLAAENRKLEENLEAASARAALVDPLETRVAELEKVQEGAEMQIRALRVEVDEERDQVEKLLRHGRGTDAEAGDAFHAMEAELDALRNENADLGRQRDVSLTAMYSALASADLARHQVAELISSEEERKLQLRNPELDDQGTHHNIRKLTELNRNLNKIRRVEAMVEEELEDGQSIPGSMKRAPSLKGSPSMTENVSVTIMRAKSAATHLDESLKKEEAGEEGTAEAKKAGFSRNPSRARIDEALAGSLADHLEAAGSKGLEPGLLSAEMEDVDEMTRSEMYKEIEMLRQREVTLAKLLKRSSSGAPDGTAAVTLLKAILDSHEQDRKQKSDLTVKKERMRAKIMNKVRQQGDNIKAVIDEKLQAETMVQIAMMRLQYWDLWNFCRRSAHAEPAGLPKPPEFGQFFEARLQQNNELSKEGGGKKMRHSNTDKPRVKKERTRKNHHKTTSKDLWKLKEYSKAVAGDDSSRSIDANAVADAASKTGDTGGKRANGKGMPTKRASYVGTLGKKQQPSKGVPLSRVLGAVAKTNRFKCKDDALREALYNYQDTPARTPEWALKVIDSVYKAAAALEAKGQKDEGRLPLLLMQHFSSQYGAKSLVQEYASAMVATVRKFEKTHIRLDIFSHFLTEEWDFHVLLMYIEAQKLCENGGSLPIPFVDYPLDPSRNRNPDVCTRKAAAIAEYLLGKRPAECTAGFAMILYRHADEARTDDVLDHFSATSEADTPEGEAATRGSFKKLKMCTFLKMLCKEAQRLHYAIRDAIPRLFRDNDVDQDGYISREELSNLYEDVDDDNQEENEASLWAMSMRIESTDAAQTGSEAQEDHIGLNAFREACMRCAPMRKYLRMNHAPPPPPELDEKDQEVQGKMLFMMADRSWREYSKSVSGIVDEMGDFLGADESILRGLMLKVEHEKSGQLKARNLVSIIKLLLDVKVSQLQHMCSPHSDDNSDLEENLAVMHKAVKAMYGWNVLVEDDYRKFRHMLDPDCTMTQRQMAAKEWKNCAGIFATYRRRMEAHAANLLKVEFAAMWLKKYHAAKQATSIAEKGETVTEMRHQAVKRSDLDGALQVMKHDENLEDEEIRLMDANGMSPEPSMAAF